MWVVLMCRELCGNETNISIPDHMYVSVLPCVREQGSQNWLWLYKVDISWMHT